MILRFDLEQETDGRWFAEIADLPGIFAYGGSWSDAFSRVQMLALRCLADRLEDGEVLPDMLRIEFQPI